MRLCSLALVASKAYQTGASRALPSISGPAEILLYRYCFPVGSAVSIASCCPSAVGFSWRPRP
jgi:hypothetical protein